MSVAYKTINVRPETYQRLTLYKVGQKSFDQVISDFMAEVEPDEFYRKLLKIHRQRIAEMKREGGGISLDEMERRLEEIRVEAK